MPSGYEKSPDSPSPLYMRLGVLPILCVVGLLAWNTMPARSTCTSIRTVDAENMQQGGKTVATLRLDKLDLKPGECVRIGRNEFH